MACTKTYRPAFEIYQKLGTGLQDKQVCRMPPILIIM